MALPMIACCAGIATAYFGAQIFPNDFDLLIFVRQATQSTLLPFSF